MQSKPFRTLSVKSRTCELINTKKAFTQEFDQSQAGYPGLCPLIKTLWTLMAINWHGFENRCR